MFEDIQVECIDHLGDDISVVNAARVSFAKQSKHEKTSVGYVDGYEHFVPTVSDVDEKLIKYLAEHNHWSPFGHAFLSFRIKAPIFVARQLVKHQIGLCWNEESRRYISTPPSFYKPDSWRGKPTDGAKQGSDGVVNDQAVWDDLLEKHVAASICHYETLLSQDIAPEQARMILPQNMMTEWIWSGSLQAFSRVCNLRLDSHAQKESRDVALQIYDALIEHFPVSTSYLVGEH